MAYTPGIYNGGFNAYGNGYGQQPYQMPVQQMPQAQQASFTPMQPTRGMDWVDGEAEAKGKQMPPGATQYAMWDINEPVIYVKSLNQYGMPNPMRKIHYNMDELNGSPAIQTSTTGLMSGEEEKHDTAQFARRDELRTMKDEIMRAIQELKTEPATAKKTVTAKGE